MCLIHLLHLQKNVEMWSAMHQEKFLQSAPSLCGMVGIYNSLDDDGTGFHQQLHKWLELFGNNHRINFCGLEDNKIHKNFYTYSIHLPIRLCLSTPM